MRKTLAIDFDGVLHTYDKWEGIDRINGKPMRGARNALLVLQHNHRLVIHTCRAVHPSGVKAVRRWLTKHDIPFDEITDKKPQAVHYIDDRGYHFTSWDRTMRDLA